MIPKFRAWDKTHKKLGLIEADMVNGTFQSVKIFDEDDDDWQVFDNFILMQSTELLDKNDKEIFEGDIVQTERLTGNDFDTKVYRGVVKQLEGCWLIDTGTEAIKLWSEIEENFIIGNIYENPDLVEEQW